MAEPIALLDVNVLIAWVDPQHVHYDPSHHWFQAHGGHGWATCPLFKTRFCGFLGTRVIRTALAGLSMRCRYFKNCLPIQLMCFGLMLCLGRSLESLRQKHFLTTGRSRMPTFLRLQCITNEGLSALRGV